MKLYYCHIDTPVGPILLSGRPNCLVGASFAHGHRVHLPEDDWVRDWSVMEFAIEQFDQYFSTKAPLRIEHQLIGTYFQQSVWEFLKTVPVGETRTYGEVSRAIGKRGANQAVAAACASNPLALLVPCHRIIAADGGFSGFSGGLKVQHLLLQHEGVRTMEDQLDMFDSDPL